MTMMILMMMMMTMMCIRTPRANVELPAAPPACERSPPHSRSEPRRAAVPFSISILATGHCYTVLGTGTGAAIQANICMGLSVDLAPERDFLIDISYMLCDQRPPKERVLRYHSDGIYIGRFL